MRTSVGSEGAASSPGRNCMKSLKTAADFQTSSSILPSMTGGLSKRTSLTGLIFSGVRRAASRASADASSDAKILETPCAAGALDGTPTGVLVESVGGDAGEAVGAAGDGAGVAAELPLPPDCC